jgi:hypothetical protein
MHLYSFYLFLLNISMHAYLFHLICKEYNAVFFFKSTRREVLACCSMQTCMRDCWPLYMGMQPGP